MEKTNVNEMNQQPEDIAEVTTLQPEEGAENANPKIPLAYQAWYKIVEDECAKARELANKTAAEHISEVNQLLFLFFNRGYTLGIAVTRSELSVYQFLDSNKKNTLTRFPIPYRQLVQFSKIARREFFKIYLQHLNNEYGEFGAYELHALGPETYIENVLPWAKTVPKSQETSKNNSTSGAQTVEPDCDNDIELIFRRRNQNQQ